MSISGPRTENSDGEREPDGGMKNVQETYEDRTPWILTKLNVCRAQGLLWFRWLC